MLVYDRTGHGHRGNYVNLFAELLRAKPLIQPFWPSSWQLITAEHLVLPTFESAPARYSLILLARAMLGKRSVAITLRSHYSPERSFRGAAKRSFYRRIAAVRAIRMLTIARPHPGASDTGLIYIEDPEFWDLKAEQLASVQSALADSVRVRSAGRLVLLFTGTLTRAKGTLMLADLFNRVPELRRRYCLVIAGKPVDLSAAEADALARVSDVYAGRFISDQELYSLYSLADLVWCCYLPHYDQSSGVFGRALQFGIDTIVRHGSMLADWQDTIGRGVRVDPVDMAEAGRILAAHAPAPRTPNCRRQRIAPGVSELILSHFQKGST